MATSYSEIVEAFLLRVELDRKFFNYRDVDEDDGLEVAKIRAFNFLREACGRLMLEGMPSVSFAISGDENGSFDFEVTPGEVYLLASLMYEQYMARDIAHLKTLNVNFAGTELRVFDPSNARKTFLSLYESVKAQNDYLLDVYKNSDRLTGMYSKIDFSSLDWEVGNSEYYI